MLMILLPCGKPLWKCYIIDVDVDETTDRVRNGTMSYWTEKKYGHLL